MRLDGLPLAYRSPYFFRLRPTFGEMRARLEERVAVRTRIAQDLHNTVPQGMSAQLCSYLLQWTSYPRIRSLRCEYAVFSN